MIFVIPPTIVIEQRLRNFCIQRCCLNDANGCGPAAICERLGACVGVAKDFWFKTVLGRWLTFCVFFSRIFFVSLSHRNVDHKALVYPHTAQHRNSHRRHRHSRHLSGSETVCSGRLFLRCRPPRRIVSTIRGSVCFSAEMDQHKTEVGVWHGSGQLEVWWFSAENCKCVDVSCFWFEEWHTGLNLKI